AVSPLRLCSFLFSHSLCASVAFGAKLFHSVFSTCPSTSPSIHLTNSLSKTHTHTQHCTITPTTHTHTSTPTQRHTHTHTHYTCTLNKTINQLINTTICMHDKPSPTLPQTLSM